MFGVASEPVSEAGESDREATQLKYPNERWEPAVETHLDA